MSKLRDIAGKVRQIANDIDDLAEEHDGDAGAQALEAMRRSCQTKRAYSSAEAAGQAAADRKRDGAEEDLRVYQCPFCKEFHLTKSKLEDFQQRRAKS